MQLFFAMHRARLEVSGEQGCQPLMGIDTQYLTVPHKLKHFKFFRRSCSILPSTE